MAILYNNGVAAGLNPTDTFIPYNNNGQFSDSCFSYNIVTLQSYNQFNEAIGLNFDFDNGVFSLGDIFNIGNGFSLYIDNGGSNLYTLTNGKQHGLFVNEIQTIIGDWANQISGTYLLIDQSVNDAGIIKTIIGNNYGGFYLDSTDFVFWFGDYNNFYSNYTYIKCNSASGVTDLNGLTIRHLTNSFQLSEITAGSLIYNTAGGSSGKHLKIFVNGVGYKIALNNL